MQVVVDDLLINYHRSGQGKVILLLHGWGQSSKNLNKIIELLSKGFDVIAVDLPGFGASQNPPSDWGLIDYAKFTDKFLKKLKASELFALVGHSNGGAIAIKAVAEDILKPNNLILISSSGIRAAASNKKLGIKILTKTAKALSRPLPNSTRNKLRRRLYSQIGSDYLFAEHLKDSFKKIVAEDLSVAAKKISIPTLLIYGELDDQTPVYFGELYHEKIANSTLEIITNAGHFIPDEKPKTVVKLIEDFIC